MNSVRETQFSNAVGQIYATIGAPGHWEHVLSCIAPMLDSFMAAVTRIELGNTPFTRVNASWNIAPEVVEAVERLFHQVGSVPGLLTRNAGHTSTASESFGEESLQRSGFWEEVILPTGADAALGTLLDLSSRHVTFIAFNRSRAANGDFTEDDRSTLFALWPHLKRAIQIQRALAEAPARIRQAYGALDHIREPMFVCSAGGHIHFANRPGMEFLNRKGHLFRERNGRLAALGPGNQETWQGALNRALDPSSPQASQCFLNETFRKCALSIAVTPLRNCDVESVFGAVDLNARALVTVKDRFSSREPDWSWVVQTFDLSAKELELCRLLYAGHSLSAAAEKLGISTETVRWRLKIVFEKTGRHSQMDLVRALSNM